MQVMDLSPGPCPPPLEPNSALDDAGRGLFQLSGQLNDGHTSSLCGVSLQLSLSAHGTLEEGGVSIPASKVRLEDDME
jgi:hypothetical protein